MNERDEMAALADWIKDGDLAIIHCGDLGARDANQRQRDLIERALRRLAAAPSSGLAVRGANIDRALSAYNRAWNDTKEIDASNVAEVRREAMTAAIDALVPGDGMGELEPYLAAALRHVDGLTAQLDNPNWQPRRSHVEQARNSIRNLAAKVKASLASQNEGGERSTSSVFKTFISACDNYASCLDCRYIDEDATITVGDLRELRAAVSKSDGSPEGRVSIEPQASAQRRSQDLSEEAGIKPDPSEATPAPAGEARAQYRGAIDKINRATDREIDAALAAPADDAAGAWQKRATWSPHPDWSECDADSLDFWREEGYEVRPLYTRPAKAVDVEAIKRLVTSAKILLQNSIGCATNHYGNDYELHGQPGFLIDCEKDIKAVESLLRDSNASSDKGGR